MFIISLYLAINHAARCFVDIPDLVSAEEEATLATKPLAASLYSISLEQVGKHVLTVADSVEPL